jgi:formylmethanofuran dehydrogenase subunit C
MIDQFRSLQNTYEEWKKLIKDENMDENKDRLRAAEESLEEQDYSEGAFHQLLTEFQDRNSSLGDTDQDIFASAVINQIGDETVSIEADMQSELNGLAGLGYRNKGSFSIEGEVDDDPVGKEMVRGKIHIDGDTAGVYGVGYQMQGGRITVDGYAKKAGGIMEDGFITVTEGAEQLGRAMEGGQVGSEQPVETLAESAQGGIAWVNDDAEEVGSYAEGGLIYVAGDAEEIGKASRGGEIYIEGEIGSIGERCDADVYQWVGGEWELVHRGMQKQPSGNQKNSTGSSKSTSSSYHMKLDTDSYGADRISDFPTGGDHDQDGYSLKPEELNTDSLLPDGDKTSTPETTGESVDDLDQLAKNVDCLDPSSRIPIEEQLRYDG